MGSIFDQKQFIFYLFFIFNPFVLDIMHNKSPPVFLTGELFAQRNVENAGFLPYFFQ